MLPTPARLAVVAAVLIALAAGPALAFCATGPAHGCCCSKEPSCPRPARPPVSASRPCCQSSPPSVPADSRTPEGTGRGNPGSPDSAPVPGAEVATPASATRTSTRHSAEGARAAPDVGLYTLHAAFLI